MKWLSKESHSFQKHVISFRVLTRKIVIEKLEGNIKFQEQANKNEIVIDEPNKIKKYLVSFLDVN